MEHNLIEGINSKVSLICEGKKDYIVTVDNLRIGKKYITKIPTQAISPIKAYNQVMRREFMINADTQDKASYHQNIYNCKDGRHYKSLLKKIGKDYVVIEG